MSGDSGGEKTEQPTPKKRRDAREKGQVAQSKELTSLSSLVTIVAFLAFSAHGILRSLSDNYKAIFQQITLGDYPFTTVAGFLKQSLSVVSGIILIPIIVGASVSLVVNILQQKGIVFSKEFLKIKFEKLNPINNAKSIFSLKTLIKFSKQFAECIVMFIVATILIKNSLNDVIGIYSYALPIIIFFLMKTFIKLAIVLFAIHLFFSIIDFIVEIRSLTKQLMMSHSEIKQEYKNTEGNPEVKQQRRELHREILEGDGSDVVENSSFLIANPTHIAIAVLYKPTKWPFPIVIKKAQNYTAQLMFIKARMKHVPIIRDKWLARQLFALAEIAKPVPVSLRPHVADLIGKHLEELPTVSEEIKRLMKLMPKPQITQSTDTGAI